MGDRDNSARGGVRAIGGDRLEDLHALLDEAIAKGARAAGLIIIYDEDHKDETEVAWEACWHGSSSPAERAFIHQGLIVVEVAEAGVRATGDQ